MRPEQGLFSLHIHHAPEWTSVFHILCTPAVAQWWGEMTRNDHRTTLAEPASRAGLPPLPTTLANDSRKARGLSFCNLSHSLPAWPQPTPRRSPTDSCSCSTRWKPSHSTLPRFQRLAIVGWRREGRALLRPVMGLSGKTAPKLMPGDPCPLAAPWQRAQRPPALLSQTDVGFSGSRQGVV